MTEGRPPRLIVVMAFDRNDDGELVTAFVPQDYAREESAVRPAQTLVQSAAYELLTPLSSAFENEKPAQWAGFI